MKNALFGFLVAALLGACAFVSPSVPTGTPTFTVVMWCEIAGDYTEWEVHEDYFTCTACGAVWKLED